MMRWAIVLVLAANIGAWLWFTQVLSKTASQSKPAPAASSAAIGELRLLSENVPEAVIPEVSKDVEQPRGCWLYGPLLMAEVRSAEAFISQQTGQALLFQRTVTTTTDYWVYLSASTSERELTRVLEELKSSGYDSFVYSEGELAGKIALSLERELEAAKQQQQYFIDLGYAAEIYEMPGYIVEHWVATNGAIDEEQEDALSEIVKRTLPSAKFSEKSCEEVASHGDFP